MSKNFSIEELLSLQGDIDPNVNTNGLDLPIEPLIGYVINWFNDYFVEGRFEEINTLLEDLSIVDKLCLDLLLSMCIMGVKAWDREPDKMLNYIPFLRKVRDKFITIIGESQTTDLIGMFDRKPKYAVLTKGDNNAV